MRYQDGQVSVMQYVLADAPEGSSDATESARAEHDHIAVRLARQLDDRRTNTAATEDGLRGDSFGNAGERLV